jgi:uncharacterized protein (DUF736 family)
MKKVIKAVAKKATKKVSSTVSKTKVLVDTRDPKFRKRLGAIWTKKVAKGKNKGTDSLSINFEDLGNFSAFRNVKRQSPKSPDYTIYRYVQQGKETMREEVGGVYNGQSADGKTNMLWLILEQRFIALPNPMKTKENHPDYLIYLAYKQPEQGWRRAGNSVAVK